jgi:hypothetical protein
MKLAISAAILGAALLWTGAAAAEPPAYTVIESNVVIPSGAYINQVDRTERDTILVRTGANHWYRILLSEGCTRGSMVGAPIRFDTSGMGGPIDRFTWVRLEDRSCAIQALDRVELVQE